MVLKRKLTDSTDYTVRSDKVESALYIHPIKLLVEYKKVRSVNSAP